MGAVISSNLQTDKLIDVLTTALWNLSSRSEGKNITKLTDLNSDCLFAVYDHLDLLSLANVADTCGRLRDTANEFFSRSRFRNLEFPFEVFTSHDMEHEPVHALTEGWAKVLRNFGPLITHFRDTFERRNDVLWKGRHIDFLYKTMELLITYCGDSLIELKICRLHFTWEMETLEKPIFPHLTHLTWHSCRFLSDYNLLPVWFPNLRELHVCNVDVVLSKYEAYDFGAMRHQFDNLWKIRLGGTVTERCGKNLLECCPRVKHVQIVVRDSAIKLLSHIFEYATEAEYLRIGFSEVFHAFDDSHFDRFHRLKKLKHLVLSETSVTTTHVVQVIHRIADAAIPLQSLAVYTHNLSVSSVSLLDAIVKLRTLEKLELPNSTFKISDIQLLCNHLQLSELYVWPNKYTILTQDILDIVRSGIKLQRLELHCTVRLDMNINEQLKAILAQRTNHKHLEIHARSYTWPIPEGWKKGGAFSSVNRKAFDRTPIFSLI